MFFSTDSTAAGLKISMVILWIGRCGLCGLGRKGLGIYLFFSRLHGLFLSVFLRWGGEVVPSERTAEKGKNKKVTCFSTNNLSTLKSNTMKNLLQIYILFLARCKYFAKKMSSVCII